MGRSKNQRRAMRLDDTDDDTLSTSSTATSSDIALTPDVEEEKDENSILEGFTDALYEKRAKTREEGLKGLIHALKSNVLTEFVENKYETWVHLCIGSVKKGAGSEVSFASQLIALIAVTSGAGDIAQHILTEVSPFLIKAAKFGSDSKARIAALEALALTCFVGSSNYEATEEVMSVLWQITKHKGSSRSDQILGINKPSAEVRAAALSAWSFLMTEIPTTRIINHHVPETSSTLLSLLENDDQAVRVSAGEGIAVLFETWNVFNSQHTTSLQDSSVNAGSSYKKHFDNREADLIEQIRGLALEAGGKGQANKKSQRSSFKEILSVVEGESFAASLKLQQGDVLSLDSWAQMLQLKFLTGVLAEGLQKHLQENSLLHEIFGFIPRRQEKRKMLTSKEKRLYMSPNSVLSKARTQIMNRRRSQAHASQVGHFGLGATDND